MARSWWAPAADAAASISHVRLFCCCRSVLSLIALVGCAGSAAAQSAQSVQSVQSVLAQSPALACLRTVDGVVTVPAYPATELLHKQGGTVRVRLEFSSADSAPLVTILSRPREGDFDDVVKADARRLRVPCMKSGEAAVSLTRDYVFDADQQSRVVASPPRDDADPARERQLKCMAHKDGETRLTWPREALMKEETGNLLMRLRFTSATEAPAVELVYAVPWRSLRKAAMERAAGMRVPCLEGAPLETLVMFKFLSHSGPQPSLVDSPLVKVLGAARDLTTPVSFDFRTMGCPFELRVGYRRPFAPNIVEQLDTADAAREPFMEWMRGLTLNLSEAASADVFNAKFVVAVPCTTLDL